MVRRPVKLLIKILLYTIIFGTFALMIFRIAIAEHYPSALQRPYVSDTLRTYATSTGTSPVLRHQELRVSYDRSREARFFAAYQYYCPEAGELQIVLRYTDSTLTMMQTELELSEVPERGAQSFFFVLRDGDGRVVSSPAVCVQEEDAFLYHYMRLVFSDIDFSQLQTGLWLDVYYAEDVDLTQEPYAYLIVYEEALAGDDTTLTLTQEELS